MGTSEGAPILLKRRSYLCSRMVLSLPEASQTARTGWLTQRREREGERGKGGGGKVREEDKGRDR